VKKIFILTGEASGDKLASEIVSYFDKKKYSILAIGSEKLKSKNIKLLFNSSSIAFMGIKDVLINFFYIIKKINFTLNSILKFKPNVIFSIDAPDFSFRIEEKIKKKYLYSVGSNIFKYIYFLVHQIRKNKFLKKSYSGGAVDLIVNHFFRNRKKGVYIDVGCYHPYNGNNTKLLYDKGWSGINIDLDFHTIDFFNHVRKRDENINKAISNKEGVENLYFFHNHAAINSLNDIRKKKQKK